jgi:hypothetical protein
VTDKAQTYDGIEIMSRISGLSKEDVKGIWAEVVANKKLLDSCRGPHDFSDMSTDGGIARSKFRCSLCKGVVNGAYRRAYEEGLAHGRASSMRIDHP